VAEVVLECDAAVSGQRERDGFGAVGEAAQGAAPAPWRTGCPRPVRVAEQSWRSDGWAWFGPAQQDPAYLGATGAVGDEGSVGAAGLGPGKQSVGYVAAPGHGELATQLLRRLGHSSSCGSGPSVCGGRA